MKIPWNSRACVLCLKEDALSEEHIIPKSLGGDLTCDFLCRDCNSKLGHKFEAKAKSAPEIRLAISNLSKELPELHVSMEANETYYSDFGEHRLIGKFREPIGIGEGKLSDGSLIVPEERAEKHLTRILEKEGLPAESIQTALQNWENAPSGEEVSLSDRIAAKKWNNAPSYPYFAGSSMLSRLIPLKISYEFMVLICGTAALANQAELNQIRSALLAGDHVFAEGYVEPFQTKDYAAFHGIYFQGNEPTATFQVRLFGKLAYRVKFQTIFLRRDKIIYTYYLKSKEHSIRELKTRLAD